MLLVWVPNWVHFTGTGNGWRLKTERLVTSFKRDCHRYSGHSCKSFSNETTYNCLLLSRATNNCHRSNIEPSFRCTVIWQLIRVCVYDNIEKMKSNRFDEVFYVTHDRKKGALSAEIVENIGCHQCQVTTNRFSSMICDKCTQTNNYTIFHA